jgi:lipopolysaccharide export system protein LptA
MRLAPSVLGVIALAGVAGAQGNQQAAQPGPFAFGKLGNSKEPITVTSDTLEYDYRGNVVRYRGRVEVVQGDVKVVSDLLTILLERNKRGEKAETADATQGAPAERTGPDTSRVREIVAEGNVRVDQGTRWAVGGRAVFDQTQRTLVLTENPVLHDGQNQVAGDRVVVYLDEDRSVVEGGQQRVKAVLYPDQQQGSGKPGGAKPGAGKPIAPGARRPGAGRAAQ